MAYTKQNFEDGQVLTAEHLNTMETELAREKSWNELTDKPFGEVTEYGDTLTWDGNTEGLVSVDAGRIVLYKISNATPTFSDINKGGLYAFGDTIEFGEGELSEEDHVTPQGTIEFLYLYIVPAEMAGVADETLGLAFPEAGVYAPVAGQIQLNGYTDFLSTTVVQIDSKYLPNATLLYVSGDYLYKSADTSNTSNRISKNEFLSLMLSGAKVFITESGDNSAVYLPCTAFGCDSGDDYGYAQINSNGNAITLYTAEYTAS